MKATPMRWVTGFLYFLCLSSCTVVQVPPALTYVDVNTGIKAGHDIDIKADNPVAQAAMKENLSRIKNALGDEDSDVAKPGSAASAPKIEVCARYVAPTLPPLPKLTEKQMEEMAKLSTERFNEALLIHMKKMYQYGKVVQATNAEALKKHLSTCRQAAVQ